MVLLGSGIGGVLRFWLGNAVAATIGTEFPWGTLVINVLGSFVIGLAATGLPGADSRTFVMVGLCGGFTTFSAYSLQVLDLLQTGRTAAAAAYVAASVIVCVTATGAGWALGRLA